MKQRQEIDLKLIEEAKNGNQVAFTKIFKHYNRIIQYYIFQMVNDTVDAEDLTMITFEKAFTKLDKYVPTHEFQTWLSKIAKNTVLDFLIHKKRIPSDFEEVNDSHNFHMPHTRTPEEQYVSKELGERLDLAIENLKENYKEIILLRYYEDLEYDEISKRLNMSENTARSHIFRARKCLIKAISET